MTNLWGICEMVQPKRPFAVRFKHLWNPAPIWETFWTIDRASAIARANLLYSNPEIIKVILLPGGDAIIPSDIRRYNNSLATRRRYTCGGGCMWHMSAKKETVTHLSAIPPPPQQTEFIGTEDEMLSAGWRLTPKELWWDWKGYTVPIFLCPECSK